MSKILIVDDSQSALMLMQQMLEDGGHVIYGCSSAREALDIIRLGVDLLITDLYMPDKDGLELIIEAKKSHPHMPIIAVSGGGGAKDLRNVASVMGASSTLQKPFSKQQLVDAVAKTLKPVAAL